MTRRVAVPRGVLALLADRTVGWYFAGKVLSSCGIWIQNIAAAVLMFELTRSAFMVGLVSTAQFLGPLVLAMWAGGLSDRIDRRKLLMAGRLISGTAVSMLATLLSVRGSSTSEVPGCSSPRCW
jgi:MFS family permease